MQSGNLTLAWRCKEMTLVIKPVRLNKTVYIRVPNDLVDLIGLTNEDAFNLTFKETEEEFRLIYSMQKPETNRFEQKTNRALIATNH